MSQIEIIDLLNKKAWKVRVTDCTLALQLSEQAYNLSLDLKYELGIAESLRTTGFCQIRLAKYDEAKISLHKANVLFTELNNLKGLATVYEYMGIIDRISGDLRLSVDHINAALTLSKKTNFIENEITNYYQLGVTYRALGNFNKALEYLFDTLNLAKDSSNSLMIGYSLNVIGSIYFQIENYEKSLKFYTEGLELRQESGDKWGEAGSLDNIGTVKLKLENWNAAKSYCEQSLQLCENIGDQKGKSNALIHLAEINYKTNHYNEALELCLESLQIRRKGGNKKGQVESLLLLGKLQKLSHKKEDLSKVVATFNEALSIAKEIKSTTLLSHVHFSLYEHFKFNQAFDKSLTHLEIYNGIEKEQHKTMVDQKVLNLEISHHAEEVEKEAEIFRLRNVDLAELNKKIEAQKETVENTLQELIATQTQLIQSEKMASLGELTAGIAHEIQNPLNFVNNFSDVSAELIEEMQYEIKKGDIEEVKAISNDIKQNLEKISHHGGRASSIVKGMLDHSRSSSDEKIPTDINALCDEYLRLSYHGMRAKDSSFNSGFETHMDEGLPKINVIPQDIGRVLLNILNNAFYACAARGARADRSVSANNEISARSGAEHSVSAEPATRTPAPKGETTPAKFEYTEALAKEYKPMVTITTQQLNDLTTITIKDNGIGMSQETIDKVFQPFFTTKPTGSGTGLGMSISYDIITKGHGGTIEVESEVGKGTKFTIELP